MTHENIAKDGMTQAFIRPEKGMFFKLRGKLIFNIGCPPLSA